MKVKEIEWKTTDVCYIAYLPFGFEAKVFKGTDNFYWQIYNDVPLGLGKFKSDSGLAQTEQETKDACQKAWEEILMEAFEKREGCEYCLGKKDISKGRIAIINKNELWSFRVNYDIFARIEYCPKCGRQLLGNSQ